MTKFPLCEELGLTPSIHEGPGFEWVVSAADLERLLRHAPVVYGEMFRKNHNLPGYDVGSIWNSSQLNAHTHTARLIGVKEIKPKTFEDKVREIMNDHSLPIIKAFEKIRELLEKK